MEKAQSPARLAMETIQRMQGDQDALATKHTDLLGIAAELRAALQSAIDESERDASPRTWVGEGRAAIQRLEASYPDIVV